MDFQGVFRSISEAMPGKTDLGFDSPRLNRVLADDIVPLASGKVYVYFSVAPAVQEGTEPLTATFSLFGHSFTVDCRAA